MEEVLYKPEGTLLTSDENIKYTSSRMMLERAMDEKKILEGRAAVCDSGHNLVVELVCMKGFIPREEAALGIADGSVRDIAIITRVNKPVCFIVTDIKKQSDGSFMAILSRRAAQEKCRDFLFGILENGDVVDARITHLEPFGCFADIGCGIVALISIDCISVSRISHPKDRFYVGDSIKAVVKEIDRQAERISLTHKELLGTWSQNAEKFCAGQTVAGIIRSIESYGIFVELAPNLAGLAEYKEGLSIGQNAAVYIKSIIAEKMKIKLSIIDAFNDEGTVTVSENNYFITGGHIDKFVYSPPECNRIIETVFHVNNAE